jgi:uncharacterized membrane protein
MTWYELWLFLHLSAVALWIGGAVAVQVYGALAKASGEPARMAALGKDTGVVVRWVFMPSALVVLISGLLLVNEGPWDWGDRFVVLGLVGWAIVAFTAFGYLSRALARVGMRMAMDGPSPALGAEMGRLIMLARILILVLFAIVFVMVVKPGL